MSTEHQQYSTENQVDKLLEYAAHHGLEIVRTYADEGKSGLNIGGRARLQKLLNDVASKTANFKVILVYDVSRWGRFQDADESAHYEYMYKQAGFRVIYCAEQFDNDGSRSRQSSKASNALCPVNTAGIFRQRFSLANAD